MGTLNILEAVRTGVPDLQRLVYACTEAIYWRLGEKGRFFEEPITEAMVSQYKQMPYFLDEVGGRGTVHDVSPAVRDSGDVDAVCDGDRAGGVPEWGWAARAVSPERGG